MVLSILNERSSRKSCSWRAMPSGTNASKLHSSWTTGDALALWPAVPAAGARCSLQLVQLPVDRTVARQGAGGSSGWVQGRSPWSGWEGEDGSPAAELVCAAARSRSTSGGVKGALHMLHKGCQAAGAAADVIGQQCVRSAVAHEIRDHHSRHLGNIWDCGLRFCDRCLT